MSVVTELGAGLLLVIGLLTPLACAAVISVMLVAGLLAHRKNGFFVFKDGYEYVLLIAVVCLALATLGPGRFSVDNAAGLSITGWAGGGIALGVAVVATGGLLATFYRPSSPPTAEPGAAEPAEQVHGSFRRVIDREPGLHRRLARAARIAAGVLREGVAAGGGPRRGARRVRPGKFEHDFRAAVVTTVYGGASEILSEIIAERRLGLPRGRPQGLTGAIRCRRLPTMTAGCVPNRFRKS